MPQMTVRRIGVLSLAKIQAVVAAAIGLIIGVIYAVFMVLFGAVMATMGGGEGGTAAAAGGIVGGVFMVVLIPLFYGVLGFAFGALSAAVYNLAAGSIGGLEMELEDKSSGGGYAYSAPPPLPGQWPDQTAGRPY